MSASSVRKLFACRIISSVGRRMAECQPLSGWRSRSRDTAAAHGPWHCQRRWTVASSRARRRRWYSQCLPSPAAGHSRAAAVTVGAGAYRHLLASIISSSRLGECVEQNLSLSTTPRLTLLRPVLGSKWVPLRAHAAGHLREVDVRSLIVRPAGRLGRRRSR